MYINGYVPEASPEFTHVFCKDRENRRYQCDICTKKKVSLRHGANHAERKQSGIRTDTDAQPIQHTDDDYAGDSPERDHGQDEDSSATHGDREHIDDPEPLRKEPWGKAAHNARAVHNYELNCGHH